MPLGCQNSCWVDKQTPLVGYPLGAYQVQGWLGTTVPRFLLHSPLVSGFLSGAHWVPIGSNTACWLSIKCYRTDWTPNGCNITRQVSIRFQGSLWMSLRVPNRCPLNVHQVPGLFLGCSSGASSPFGHSLGGHHV